MKYRVSYIDSARRAHISLCDSAKEAAESAGAALALSGNDFAAAIAKSKLLGRWMASVERGLYAPGTLELGDVTIARITEQEAAQWQRAF